MSCRRLVGLLVVLLVAATGHIDVPAQEPVPEWTLRLDATDTPLVAAWSPTSSCVAIATGTTISVISAGGDLLWRWNFRQTSRWITVPRFQRNTLAVSPTCEHVALAGDPSYRFVWTADRAGQSAFLQTVGTPFAVVFDLKGEHVAVSTGAGRAYLLSPSLEPGWTGRLDKLPIRWPAQVGSGTDFAAAEFTQAAVNALLGGPWGYKTRDSISDDGQWRVVIGSPWARDDGWQMLELYGTESRGYHGRWAPARPRIVPRWSKPMGCLDAEITRDGEFILATGDPKHPDYNAWGSDCFTTVKQVAIVFDRAGTVVATQPLAADGVPDRAALAEVVLRKTGKPLVLMDDNVWTGPCASGLPICLTSGDGRTLITNRANEVRAYRVP